MPIPQLNNRKNQSWRNNRKKYYVSKNRRNSLSGKRSRVSSRTSRSRSLRKSGGFFSSGLKKKLLIAAGLTTLACVMLVFIYVAWISRNLPNPDKLMDRDMAQTTKIYDRTGQTVLYEINGDQKRTLVTLNEIPAYVKDATIAMEDKDFYKHGAISLWGIFRGVVLRVLEGKSPQGGSTLTQQFVKNAILTDERTITRKVKEWILSYRLEQMYTKDQILQMYFNEIPYGSTAYGVEAASERYFGKSVKDDNLAEAAILAALPQAPSRYSPYGPNKDLLISRQHYILDLMVNQGYITKDQAETAKNYPLVFQPPTNNIIAPHFVMYVKELLSDKYGEKMVEQGGLKIYTTLDLYKQKLAEKAIADHADANEKNYNASNEALVSIDPKTGQILAMVGSRDYFNDKIDGQFNVATSPRQPGSSLKPLVYSAAFLKGYTPNTVLYDVVTNFSSDPSNPYEPHDYEDKELGPVTIRQALAGSLNIPAVKTIYLTGIDNVLNLAHDFGYTTLNNRDRYGLSLVLGGGEVELLEHTDAYGVFAREGIYHPTSAILKVVDKNGKVLEQYQPQQKQVLDPKVAREINDILSDNQARAFAFGVNNYLTLPNRPVAAKTGTTNDYRDAWTMGYTPSLVAGVWVGNNDNSPMKRGAAGAVVAAPIWNEYMKSVLGDTPVETFNKPDIPKTGKPILDGQIGVPTTYKIDKSTGLLATQYTPADMVEEKSYFQPHCILYYVNKDDPLGPAPTDPSQDPQFQLWESRVVAWANSPTSSASSILGAASSTFASATSTFSSAPPPTEYDNLHTLANQPQVEIVEPTNNETINQPLLNARINATAPRGVTRAEYYVNGNLIYVNASPPFGMSKDVSFLPNGFNNLKVKVCDDVDNCTTKEQEFNLALPGGSTSKDFSVSLTSPASGLAVTNIDFPLNIQFSVTDPSAIASLNIYSLPSGGNTPQKITSLTSLSNTQPVYQWQTVPPSGTYNIYGEAVGWSGDIKKTDQATIIVNRIGDTASSTNTTAVGQ